MRKIASCLLVLLGTGLWMSPSRADVIVTFVDPQRFADIGRDAQESGKAQREIAQHLQRLGRRYLAPDQKLKVEILDVNLAGDDEVLRGGQDVRVLRGRADWPSMKLRYVLEGGAGSTESGEERIADMTYLLHGTRSRSSEYLPHEKQLLEKWFKARIVDRERPPR